MLISFFGHSEGTGDRAAEYIADEENRSIAPQVLEGDLDRTVALINSISRKHTHTSGVISFAKSDAPSISDIMAVIQDFKAHFFAGLDADQFDITFVRHCHLGREEIHFLTPRLELLSGKDLNIAPPTSTYAFKESFVKAWNLEKGWADPGDPARARELSHPPVKEERRHGLKLHGTREQIHAYVTDMIVAGTVVDRPTLIAALQDVGLPVHRQGKDYISVTTDSGDAVRLKGRIYGKDWTYDQELDRADSSKDTGNRRVTRAIDRVDPRAAWKLCFECRDARESQNRKRYQRPTDTFEHTKIVDLDHDSVLCSDHDSLFALSLRPELIPRPVDRPKVEPGRGAEPDARPAPEPARGVPPGNTGGDVSGPSGADDARVRGEPVSEPGRLTDVGTDSARERASAHVAAAARDLVRFRDTASVAAEANNATGSSLVRLVQECVGACKEALRDIAGAVKSWFSSPSSPEKKDDAPRRNRSEPGEAPGF